MSKEIISKREDCGLEWVEVDLGNIEVQQFIPAVKRKNHKLEKELKFHLISYIITIILGVIFYAFLELIIQNSINADMLLRFFIIYTVTYLLCELSCLIYDVYKKHRKSK